MLRPYEWRKDTRVCCWLVQSSYMGNELFHMLPFRFIRSQGAVPSYMFRPKFPREVLERKLRAVFAKPDNELALSNTRCRHVIPACKAPPFVPAIEGEYVPEDREGFGEEPLAQLFSQRSAVLESIGGENAGRWLAGLNPRTSTGEVIDVNFLVS
jgi:hypothetical protein